MPFKRRGKRSFRRRPGRKLRRRTMRRSRNHLAAPSRVVSRVIGGFPDRYFCKLRATGQLSPSGASTSYMNWCGNSPVALGPSNQGGALVANSATGVYYLICNPADNPAVAPYLTGRVWGSKCVIRYVPTSTGPSSVRCYLFPSNVPASTIGVSSIGTVGEQPYVKGKACAGQLTTSALTMKSFQSTRRQEGLLHKGAVEGDINLSFNWNSRPTTDWWWNFYIYGDGVTGVTGIVEYEITYFVEFFDRSSPFTSAVPA